MKRLFPLMFSLMFARQVFAVDTNAVDTNVVDPEIISTEVVVNEEDVAKAAIVFNTLKESGLSGEQIVAIVREQLKNETTENEYHSVLRKNKQEKIVWMLVGAAVLGVAIVGVKYGIPAVKSIYANLTEEKAEKSADQPSVAQAPVAQPSVIETPAVEVPVVQPSVIETPTVEVPVEERGFFGNLVKFFSLDHDNPTDD